MSLGFSIADAILLSQSARKAVQNARRAYGSYDELTREVRSLHVVLQRLELEVDSADSPINRPGTTYREEIEIIAGGCKKVLSKLNGILEKHKILHEKEWSVPKLWHRIRFGNGQMSDLGDLRGKLTFYTSALSLSLTMMSTGSMGRVEMQMDKMGGDLKNVKFAVNGITARFRSRSPQKGSTLTVYSGDNRIVWREFRRELVKEGFSSSVLREHKSLIKSYIRELTDRGALSQHSGSEENEITFDETSKVSQSLSATSQKTFSQTAPPSVDHLRFPYTASLLSVKTTSSMQSNYYVSRGNKMDVFDQISCSSDDSLAAKISAVEEYISQTRERLRKKSNPGTSEQQDHVELYQFDKAKTSTSHLDVFPPTAQDTDPHLRPFKARARPASI